MSNKLQSGQEYTLSDLFNGNNKIIIPDLQRDYCWGDIKHGKEKEKIELVSGFIDSLFENFENNDEKLNLGILYGYENPINHINFADGQQRITTLILLLGVLYGKIKNESLKEILISKFELDEDDQEPRLQYAIRESTLYFLSDLVVNFFLASPDYKTDEISKKSDWYFSEYDQDPSIQSMLKALEIIEKKLFEKENDKLVNFADFIINKITFLYFDMESRERGEDLFVIINTTGEPLSATENLKPILLGEKVNKKECIGDIKNSTTEYNFNYEWEERETFFWQNRKDGEQEADNGVKDFLTWYVRIQKQIDEVNLHKYFSDSKNKKEELENIEKHFKKSIKLLDYFKEDIFINILKQIFNRNEYSIKEIRTWTSTGENPHQQNILLPLLYFMVNISDEKKDVYQFLRRLRKNYFDNQRKERNINYVDWRDVLRIIENQSSLKGVLHLDNDLKEISNVQLPKSKWYNDEEKIKDKIKKKNKIDIEKWEDHPDFMGDISPLLKIALGKTLKGNLLYSEFGATINDIKLFYESYIELNNNIPLNNGYKLFSGMFEVAHGWHKDNGGHYDRLEQIPNCFLFELDNFFDIWKNKKTILDVIKDKIKKQGLSQLYICALSAIIRNDKVESLSVYRNRISNGLYINNSYKTSVLKCGYTIKRSRSMKNSFEVGESIYEIHKQFNIDSSIIITREEFIFNILHKLHQEFCDTRYYILKENSDKEVENLNDVCIGSWISVAIPIEDKYLIAFTTNGLNIEIGYRKWLNHERKQESIQHKFENENNNHWWYNKDDYSFNDFSFLDFEDTFNVFTKRFKEVIGKRLLNQTTESQ